MLGDGGLGTALRVQDRLADRELVMKVAKDHARLRREHEVLRGAVHARLPVVHDFGFVRSGRRVLAYYTSGLVEGAPLSSFARWEDIAVAVGDVLSAIASLHRRGVLHGDVHPGNVIVDAAGRGTLIDLSCCRPLADTRATEISGTLAVLAPEMRRGVVHPSADSFALGASLRDAGISLPPRVASAVARMTAPRVEDRPTHPEEAAEQLGVPFMPPPLSDRLGGRLVGRDREMKAARDHAIVLVRGHAGSGRTRLLEELKAEMQRDEEAVLVDCGRPGALETAQALFGDRVRWLLDDADALSTETLSRFVAQAKHGVVMSARRRLEVEDLARIVELPPLDANEVRAWIEDPDLPDASVREIARETQGYPKRIAAVLGRIEGAEWSRHAVRRALDAHTNAPSAAEDAVNEGEPARALALLVTILRGRPTLATRVEALVTAGRAYVALGDSRRAIAVLRRAMGHVVDDRLRSLLMAALALAYLKRGDDAAASGVVAESLSIASPDPQARIDSILNGAFATSRLGRPDEARALLAMARASDVVTPRSKFRTASATAFVEFGAGDPVAAIAAYREALDIAEENALDDVIASAALNYAAAAHERGDLGRALDGYTRGSRIAASQSMPTTAVMLAFGLAKVLSDIGSFDRAAHHGKAARVRAREESMTLIEAGTEAVLADVAAAAGDEARALAHLDVADGLLDRAAATDRDRAAVYLQRARIELDAGLVEAAALTLRARFGDANANALPLEALGDDARAGWLALRGAISHAKGRVSDATELLERAVTTAEPTGQRHLIADLEARLARAYDAATASQLAKKHGDRARELFELTLAALSPDLHDSFRRHPLRRDLFRPSVVGPSHAPSPDLRRLLAINRRLASATTTTAVLEELIEAAIDLTHAERGFLLVAPPREGDPVKVAVARNFDRENLKRGTLKFSHTVAERVMRTGEPVVAVDAAVDPRFAKARSVHAMQLKSFLCVPIRSADAILGALYVDRRLSTEGFRDDLVEVVVALADQAAVAMARATLVEELREKTRELEERNAEVERLARGQAMEIQRLVHTLETSENRPSARFDYGSLVATSAAMRSVLGVLDRVIDTDVTVLVRGESGTGKERIARAIHHNGARARGPFVAINCGALPESLLEAELFGYRKGAFSGAMRDHPGLFVAAKGGTLFLDELGEMPPSMQVKLLRVLQEREVRPLGSNESVAVDIRLVCATNRNLAEEVRAGRFREDLYYRVAIVDLELPPLRERLDDVLPLAHVILARLAITHGRPEASLDRSAERELLGQPWPGNVRELENVLTKAFLLGSHRVLSARDLATPAPKSPNAALRTRITTALQETDWNVVTAARLLAMPRATLYRKMRRFKIERPAK